MSTKFSAKTKAAVEPAAAPPPEPSPPAETQNEKVLRIIKAARERLRGRGMPELDQEIDELITEVEGWGK